MRIALVTDAWAPQVNGVVTTLRTVISELVAVGHEVEVIHPGLFRSVPCPTYPEIRLAPFAKRAIAERLTRFTPDALHIATEGPLGIAARSVAVARGWPFTTAYHTRFPEYVNVRFRVPMSWTYRGMRWFHRGAERIMVATTSLADELTARGMGNVALWNRGVDIGLFRADLEPALRLPPPVHVYVGRVAVEKNLEAFLGLALPGSKLVVGDGPARKGLEAAYPDAVFVGAKHGEDLARHYAAGDVFVFPSRTDTFGLVLLEALASGLPVAAFPVPGPLDVVGFAPEVGALDEDLGAAIERARGLDPAACRAFAANHTWRRCAERFLALLEPIRAGAGAA